MVDPHNLTRDFAKWKRRNEFPIETRIQDLRGSYVSLLIESGVDIKTVQELARHESPITTMRMYARSRQQVQAEAVLEKLRGKIAPAVPPSNAAAELRA
jgi:integrase